MVSGCSPVSPKITAISVPCPLPVFASEPYNNISIEVTFAREPFALIDCRQLSAAFHGPRVCELEGPMPILNMSKTEIASCGMETLIEFQK